MPAARRAARGWWNDHAGSPRRVPDDAEASLMHQPILYETPAWALCAALLVMLSIAVELGFRIGLRRRQRDQTAALGAGTMEAAVFGLFGLLLALTFSFVVSRGDDRRRLVVEETNAIGTAYLRFDLADDPLRAELRAKLRAYVGERANEARAGADLERANEALDRAVALQRELWADVVRQVRAHPEAESWALVMASMNDLIDMQGARDAVLQAHLPAAVLGFLALTAIVAATVAGYTLGVAGQRHGVASVGFVVLTVLVALVILDMDRPRRGFFRAPVELILQLEATMKNGPP
jgi:hypothetical protein